MDAGSKLRAVLDSPEITPLALVSDTLTARLAEVAGYPTAVLGSTTVQSALLAVPDGGILTLTEMEFVVSRAADACEIPLLVDTQIGYGDVVEVARATRVLERAGAAGIFFEDHEQPPRSHGGPVISATDMVGKIRAALDSRRDDSFVIIARTDAWYREPFDSVIERGQQYIDAGADGFFVDGPTSGEEKQRIAKEVPARFHVGGNSEGGAKELEDWGFSAVVKGVALVFGIMATLRCMEEDLHDGGTRYVEMLKELSDSPFAEWRRITRDESMREFEQRYLRPEVFAHRYDSPHQRDWSPDTDVALFNRLRQDREGAQS